MCLGGGQRPRPDDPSPSCPASPLSSPQRGGSWLRVSGDPQDYWSGIPICLASAGSGQGARAGRATSGWTGLSMALERPVTLRNEQEVCKQKAQGEKGEGEGRAWRPSGEAKGVRLRCHPACPWGCPQHLSRPHLIAPSQWSPPPLVTLVACILEAQGRGVFSPGGDHLHTPAGARGRSASVQGEGQEVEVVSSTTEETPASRGSFRPGGCLCEEQRGRWG